MQSTDLRTKHNVIIKGALDTKHGTHFKKFNVKIPSRTNKQTKRSKEPI